MPRGFSLSITRKGDGNDGLGLRSAIYATDCVCCADIRQPESKRNATKGHLRRRDLTEFRESKGACASHSSGQVTFCNRNCAFGLQLPNQQLAFYLPTAAFPRYRRSDCYRSSLYSSSCFLGWLSPGLRSRHRFLPGKRALLITAAKSRQSLPPPFGPFPSRFARKGFPKLGEHVPLSGADGDHAKNYEEKNVATPIQNAQKANSGSIF